MSKIIPTHNGIEADSVNGPVNFTTGLKVNGDTVVAVAPQTDIADLTPSGDLAGADTVSEAGLEAAILALENKVNAILAALRAAGILA